MQVHRPSPLERRAHERWIVAELDARGEIEARRAVPAQRADATGPGATEWHVVQA